MFSKESCTHARTHARTRTRTRTHTHTHTHNTFVFCCEANSWRTVNTITVAFWLSARTPPSARTPSPPTKKSSPFHPKQTRVRTKLNSNGTWYSSPLLTPPPQRPPPPPPPPPPQKKEKKKKKKKKKATREASEIVLTGTRLPLSVASIATVKSC